MPPELQASERPTHVRRDVAILVALVALTAVPSMFTRDLWNPDEVRYMEVAHEMFASGGSLLIPHLNGGVYTDKPPLFFWVAGLLWKLGCGIMSARILAALASLGTLLVTYFLSRRFLKGDGPLLSAGATLGLILFAGHAKIGVIDPFHSLLVAGATVSGYLALRRAGPRPALWWLAAYGLAGLDVLTKGPVGMALPGLVLLVYALLDRKGVRAGGWTHLPGAALMIALPLAWLVPALVFGPTGYGPELLGQKTMGYVADSWSHAKPFYYFTELAPLLLLPWTLLLVPAVRLAVLHRREEDGRPALFALVWLAVTYAFFSCISGKRFAYVLPASPAVGILVAWCLSGGVLKRHPGWRRAATWLARVTAAGFGLVFAAGTIAVLFYPARLVRPLHTQLAMLGPGWQAVAVALLALPLCCCVAAWLWAGRRPARCVPALMLAVVLGGLWFDVSAAPLLNGSQSAAPFCRRLRPHLHAGNRLLLYNADFSGAVNLYTGRAVIPTIERESDLRAALRDPKPSCSATGSASTRSSRRTS